MVRKLNNFYKLLFYSVLLAFLFLIVIPIIYTIGISFFEQNSFKNIKLLLQEKSVILLLKSCLLAFLIAVFSTLLGTVLGFLLYKTQLKFRNFFKISLLIPLFISPYILAVAWKDFFIIFGNNTFLTSFFGVFLVLTIVFTPLSMLIVGSALSNINSQIEESGLLISKLRKVIFRIILPLIKPAIISSFVLVFIFSISEFSVPAFFGVKVFSTEIFIQFSAFYNYSLAILQSFLLIIICILLLFLEKKYISNAPFLSFGTKGTKSKIYDIKSTKLLILFGYFFISVILPFVVLIYQSFANGTSYFVKAFHLLLPTFKHSIGLAFLGAIFIVFVGFIAAYRFENQNNKNIFFEWILLIVFAFPSIILGISLIKFYNQPAFEFIYSSSAIILIAYVGKFTFISSKLIGNSIKQIPKSIDEVAQIQGISFFNRIRKILIPSIMPTIFVAFVISFIFNLGELSTTIMLYPPGTEIMPIKVYTIMANAPQSLVSSMTLIVFSVTILIISSFYLWGKKIIKY